MGNNKKFLIVILTVIIVILAACSNSSEESSANLENQSQNGNLTQKNSHKEAKRNTSNTDIANSKNGNSENSNTNNEEPTNAKDSANNTSSLKAKYIKKLNDTKYKVEEMRKSQTDDTTFALKKVEGDIYDIWDGLLNEIYGVLKKHLSEDEMDQLRKEQRDWIENRDHIAKEASLKYKGGTMEQLEYVRVENNLTEGRCYEFVNNYLK